MPPDRALRGLRGGRGGEEHLSTVQVAVLEEALEKVVRRIRDVRRHFVRAASSGGICEITMRLDVASRSTVNVPGTPFADNVTVQRLETKRGVEHRDGGNVDISRIHKNVHIRALLEQALVARNHRGARGVVRQDRSRRALGPLARRRLLGVNGSLDVCAVQVVHHGGRNLTSALRGQERQGVLERSVRGDEIVVQVVNVQGGLSTIELERAELLGDTANATEGLGENQTAFSRVGFRLTARLNPSIIRMLRHHTVPKQIVEHHITSIELLAGNHGVPKESSGELIEGIGGGVVQDDVPQRREVNSGVRLTRNPDRTTNILWESLQEAFNKIKVIHGRLGIGAFVLIARDVLTLEGKPDSARLLHVHHVCHLVPRDVREREGTISVGSEGTMLTEETKKTRATRSSVGPEDKRGIFGVLHSGEVHVEVIALTWFVDGDVTRIGIEVEGRAGVVGKGGGCQWKRTQYWVLRLDN
mmetsp:Transcript_19140/g.53722  ORF Transcript_19140/g.53722 Transcript_19140/m.53722 type:complete len:473 (-) Transcript_19140:89-1507(-)